MDFTEVINVSEFLAAENPATGIERKFSVLYQFIRYFLFFILRNA